MHSPILIYFRHIEEKDLISGYLENNAGMTQ